MTSALMALRIATDGSLDAVTLSAAWSAIAGVFPAASATNEDRTLTWAVGGARTISAVYGGSNTLQYRINSGAWTTYTAGFSVSSGNTLGWRVQFGSSEANSVQVNDSARGTLIQSFSVTGTGYP